MAAGRRRSTAPVWPRDPSRMEASVATPGVRPLLSGWLAARALRARVARRVPVVGLCAAQGAGKSTACAAVQQDLAARGLRVAVLALDDFYLTRAERQDLARREHPLFATRGVPGTHDAGLLAATLDALRVAPDGGTVAWPRFDKAADDRSPTHHHWRGRPDLVLLEGWCVGLPPEPASRLAAPVNDLERDEDADGRWRAAVNAALGADYARAWSRLDARVALLAPDWSVVAQWRGEQERGIADRTGPGRLHDGAALRRFLAHYERLTRWSFEIMPGEVDLAAWLDMDRRMLRWRAREPGAPVPPTSSTGARDAPP